MTLDTGFTTEENGKAVSDLLGQITAQEIKTARA
jgi:hypothetical protein